LPRSVAVDGCGGTLRDEASFHYKSFLNNRLIKIGACTIWLKVENGLLIGDMEPCTEEQLDAVLEQLQKLAKKLGINEITFQFIPHSVLDAALKKRLPVYESWAIGYKNYASDIPLDKLRFPYGDLDTF